jgi:hypothetical protein
LSKKKKDNGPGGTHRIRAERHYRVRFKSKAMKKPRSMMKSSELTGKEILERAMNQVWSSIRRKEMKAKRRYA